MLLPVALIHPWCWIWALAFLFALADVIGNLNQVGQQSGQSTGKRADSVAGSTSAVQATCIMKFFTNFFFGTYHKKPENTIPEKYQLIDSF
jgi:hypothetical protein